MKMKEVMTKFRRLFEIGTYYVIGKYEAKARQLMTVKENQEKVATYVHEINDIRFDFNTLRGGTEAPKKINNEKLLDKLNDPETAEKNFLNIYMFLLKLQKPFLKLQKEIKIWKKRIFRSTSRCCIYR